MKQNDFSIRQSRGWSQQLRTPARQPQTTYERQYSSARGGVRPPDFMIGIDEFRRRETERVKSAAQSGGRVSDNNLAQSRKVTEYPAGFSGNDINPNSRENRRNERPAADYSVMINSRADESEKYETGIFSPQEADKGEEKKELFDDELIQSGKISHDEEKNEHRSAKTEKGRQKIRPQKSAEGRCETSGDELMLLLLLFLMLSGEKQNYPLLLALFYIFT